MKTTIEQELKFEGDDIEIDRLGGDPIEPHIFASSYHDTADRRLLRAGDHPSAACRERGRATGS